MKMPKVQKNDNLQKYRQRQQEKNLSLVQRAIDHIHALGGDINFSLVSKVTYDIADATKEEKGVSLAGLSKNPLYRSMIEKAKMKNGIGRRELPHDKVGKVSVGDMQMSFHALRVENAKLKMENKVLSARLQQVEEPKQELDYIDMRIIKQYEQMQKICSSLVGRLLELEIVYIDIQNESLRVAMYEDIVLQREALRMFYAKELDAIKH